MKQRQSIPANPACPDYSPEGNSGGNTGGALGSLVRVVRRKRRAVGFGSLGTDFVRLNRSGLNLSCNRIWKIIQSGIQINQYAVTISRNIAADLSCQGKSMSSKAFGFPIGMTMFGGSGICMNNPVYGVAVSS